MATSYIADTGNNRILKETLSGGIYTQSSIVSSGLGSPWAVAVDAAGNVFIADPGNNRALKESPSGGSYIQTTIPTSSLNNALGIAVDSADNVYIVQTISGTTSVLKESAPTSAVELCAAVNVGEPQFRSHIVLHVRNWRLYWKTGCIDSGHGKSGFHGCRHGNLHDEWNYPHVQRQRYLHRRRGSYAAVPRSPIWCSGASEFLWEQDRNGVHSRHRIGTSGEFPARHPEYFVLQQHCQPICNGSRCCRKSLPRASRDCL